MQSIIIDTSGRISDAPLIHLSPASASTPSYCCHSRLVGKNRLKLDLNSIQSQRNWAGAFGLVRHLLKGGLINTGNNSDSMQRYGGEPEPAPVSDQLDRSSGGEITWRTTRAFKD